MQTKKVGIPLGGTPALTLPGIGIDSWSLLVHCFERKPRFDYGNTTYQTRTLVFWFFSKNSILLKCKIIWIVSPGAYFEKGGLGDILAH